MTDRSETRPITIPLLALVAWISLPAKAAEGEFSVGSNFLSVELSNRRSHLGSEISQIRKLPAQTLSQLMAAARGELKAPILTPVIKGPFVPGRVLATAPLVFVSGPKTKGQWTKVELPDPAKIKEHEEEEILREAEAGLQMNLPEPKPMKAETIKLAQVPSKISKQTAAAEDQIPGLRLQLRDDGKQLVISPKQLVLSLLNPGVAVMDQGLPGSAQIFLRNPKMVRWDAKSHRLQAQELGRTELYISYRDQLYIVPIEVQGGMQRDPLLAEVPASFQKLTSIMPMLEQPYASFDGDSVGETLPAIQAESPQARPALTLANSAAEVDATQVNQAKQLARYFYPDASPDYKTVGIQVLDERSAPEQQEIYPVSGVTVRLLGTQLAARTDAKGHAMFGELPEGSRFFVQIEDDKGLVVPTIAELVLPLDSGDQVLRARTINYRSYLAYLNIIDRAQDTSRGSICARAMSDDARLPLDGMQVALNVGADGPYYIGRFGPQTDLQATDRSGRFCFFNVTPGLVELTFSQGGQYQTSVALPIFAGSHSEEDLPLQGDRGGRLFLAAMPSAVDQIYEEKQILDQPFQAVDYVDMLTVGDNRKLSSLGTSVLGYDSGNSPFKGRLYTLTQAPEFETSLYTVDKDQEISRSIRVLPLLQRGFIEDIFHELANQDSNTAIAFDPALGSAVILHRLGDGQDQVRVSLIDSSGQVFDQGWSYGSSSQGLAHTAFFNLQPGVYQVKVESTLGALLALNTFAVDFWTSAVVQTGSSLHYNIQQQKPRED